MQECRIQSHRARRQHSSDAAPAEHTVPLAKATDAQPPLEADHRAARWESAGPERPEGLDARSRKRTADQCVEGAQRGAVRSSVCQEQDRDRDAAIATLQRDPALDSLEINKAGLGLDANALTVDAQDGVPGAEISGRADQNFGLPGDP